MLKNPFIIYILSFGGVLAVYQLGWSEAYPELSFQVLAFFGLTFLVSAVLAIATAKFVQDTGNYEPDRLPKYTVLLLAVFFAADIVYTGGAPLLLVVSGKATFSGDLGVPHLHVFTGTFAIVFSAIRFADFIYSRRVGYLAEAVLSIVYFILIFYRGPALMCVVSWVFVFFIRYSRIGVVRGSVIVASALLVLHLFGIFGNLREGSSEAIEAVGKPTAAFRESGIPPTYLWTYIYMTSPMANLQLAVDTTNMDDQSTAEFVVSEMIPDFISKRILPFLGTERVKTPEVSRGLNVATMYGRSYVYAGWTGCMLLFTLFASLVVVYLQLIRYSPYRVPCLALLNMFIVFCTFQNMIAFSGLILQLVWPLLLPSRRSSSATRGSKPALVLEHRSPAVGRSAD